MLNILGSRNLTTWLTQHHISLAISTYQAGKLLLVGTKPDGGLAIFERTFNRCMGLWGDAQTIWMSTRYQLWRLENMLTGQSPGGEFDRLFVPQVGYTTGDIDIHDVAVDGDGNPIFISTLFNCIATISQRRSFTPLWRPSFISKLAAEDRCHLNGMAMQDGRPRYVTACSRSDVIDGWRDRRHDGGVVIDVRSDQIIADGLSMPHSPRLYQNRLWLLDSGNGFLGFVDDKTGTFERVAFCPGYARGLALIGDYAVVGLSKPRDDEQSFRGLNLDRELASRDAAPRCGVQVIDLRSGNVVHWIRMEGDVIGELYDVVVLPDTRRPKALGFKTDEIERNVWFDEGDGVQSWSAGG
ncbi:TIGR03032 family protein [Stieleria sp.]|uniref:TIGR03032 family protein n=1 Tax=Stieleria sp. TaxID=2795976 RepID=UPI0035671D34